MDTWPRGLKKPFSSESHGFKNNYLNLIFNIEFVNSIFNVLTVLKTASL